MIRLLPPLLINRIAAGEVIERPASVVKELVDNAIDADATLIQVRINDAGQKLIEVCDNGKGMKKDDLELCIERHATSKLDHDDLLAINTLGFRGEALPSIGSVSRLTLTSKHQENDEAWLIHVDAGKKEDLKPASHPVGTTVCVEDLFYATPARLKFLKSPHTEVSHIKDIIERCALSHPHISFRLILDEKVSIDFPASRHHPHDTILNRLSSIFGKDILSNHLIVDVKKHDMTLWGVIGLPTYSKSNSLYQYLFVNNRPLRDKQFSGILRAAYQDFMGHDRYPVSCLFLDLPTQRVDINVHPAKSEMRFEDQNQIRGFIISAIRGALTNASPKTSNAAIQKIIDLSHNQTRLSYGAQPSFLKNPSYTNTAEQLNPLHLHEENRSYHVPTPHAINEDFPLGNARAQIHNTYIISETNDKLIITDQHAAHERIIYETMKKNFAENGIKKQLLLLPEVVELSCEKVALLEDYISELTNFGLSIEVFGNDAVLVREIPFFLEKDNIKNLINDLCDELKEMGTTTTLNDRASEICGNMACHTSIRAGRKLSIDEMNGLLRQMENTPNTSQCNHGRPTFIEFSKNQLESLFKRR